MHYKTVGLMSGTSLDGLDVVLCSFLTKGADWHFSIHHGVTIPFPGELVDKLRDAHHCSGSDFAALDLDFGIWCGRVTGEMIRQHHFHPVFIASHGHTVFHDPSRGITCQIGNGAGMAYHSGLPVINGFRIADVLSGGQGAPLIPVGDHHLFTQYDYCLNLGGIANISYVAGEIRLAFDIVPVNMVLNHLAGRLNMPFDPHGVSARSGKLISEILDKLNDLPFYVAAPPKSLSREWVEASIFPLLEGEYGVEDLLHTYVEHVALQIAASTSFREGETMLVTGGGTWNDYLVERIRSTVSAKIIIPGKEIVNFKEALVFAFMGLLRWLGLPNVFASVTGCRNDHSAGVIWYP